MFNGMIIAIYQFYCVQGRVAILVNGSCYYTESESESEILFNIICVITISI